MLPIENETINQVRNPARPDAEAGPVRLIRTPNPLFRGWGPKLFAAALALSGLVVTNKPAFANDQPTIAYACADQGAALLSNPILETPEGVGASGQTIMRVDLSAAGRVHHIAIVQTSGNFDLDFAATREVIQSRYEPAKMGCRAAEDSVLYSVTFAE
jgi:hypothetical protein